MQKAERIRGKLWMGPDIFLRLKRHRSEDKKQEDCFKIVIRYIVILQFLIEELSSGVAQFMKHLNVKTLEF